MVILIISAIFFANVPDFHYFLSRNVKYDPADICASGRSLLNLAHKKGGPVEARGGVVATDIPIYVAEFGKSIVVTITPILDAVKQILTTPQLEEKFKWGSIRLSNKNGIRVFREFNSGDWLGKFNMIVKRNTVFQSVGSMLKKKFTLNSNSIYMIPISSICNEIHPSEFLFFYIYSVCGSTCPAEFS